MRISTNIVDVDYDVNMHCTKWAKKVWHNKGIGKEKNIRSM